MRLLDSVCKVLADNYADMPVYVEQVPNDFIRPSFFVELVTDPKAIKNYHIYQNNPTFQIVYFGERDIANQVLAEPLYMVEDRLEELFLLSLAIPVVAVEGKTEKRRYAKILSFTTSVRLDEGALYCNLTLDFTEQVPHNEDYELIEDVTVDMNYNKED